MTKIFISQSVLVTLFSTLLFLFSFSSTLAANHVVTPLVFNFDLEKRDIITEYITVTNTTQSMIRVYASVNTVAVDGGVIESFVPAVSADKTITPTTWIEISRKRMEISAGESIEVPFTIRMSPLTKPGNYDVFIGFAQASNKEIAKQKVSSGQAPGAIVRISVDQTQNQFLRLKKFLVDRFIINNVEEAVSFTLNNPGIAGVVPFGEVIFYDTSGNEVKAMNVNVDGKTIPANEDMLFTMDIPEELAFGKYKAFLSVEYGENLTAAVYDTTFFYIVPLKQIITIFIVFSLSAVAIALYIHRRYDVDEAEDGAEEVTLYVKEGTSQDHHHDIDLTKKDET